MQQFSVGDEIEIVRHRMDSKENLQIGTRGTILVKSKEVTLRSNDGGIYRGDGYLVRWKKYIRKEEWWVHPACIELIELNLENE